MEYKEYRTDIAGENYNQLLNVLQVQAPIFSFVTRTDRGINPSKARVLQELEPFLITQYATNEWLTNIIFHYKKVGRIYYYQFTNETLQILKKYSSSLFEWGESDTLPEDISFLSKNEKTVLTVNGHFNYFYVSFALLDKTKGLNLF